MNDNKCCLVNILKVIEVLQCASKKIDCVNNSCGKPYLGNNSSICFNTRLITFYRCDNTIVGLPYLVDGVQTFTSVFRIESVSNDAVTVLLISQNTDGTYSSTNTFATINLDCICAIQCIGDTTINNI